MRILLAAKHPPGGSLPIGGVQTWIATIAAQLAGHDVVTWGPEWPLPSGEFDIGILANTMHTGAALARCKRSLVVSHGIIPDEQPIGGDLHAFTSEGVKRHWGGTGPVIRQPIDLSFWTPGEGRRALVRYSYRSGLVWLPQVAERLGLPFVHLRDVTHAQAREALRGAACVLATGRAALEAMACGVPVVICDDREYQGPLMSFAPAAQMMNNYSGRGGLAATRPDVERGIDEAMRFGSLRHHVETHHDAAKIAAEILCLPY